MRSLFIFILFGFLMVLIQSRPSHSDDNNGRESDYEGDNGTPTDENVERSRFRDEDPTSQEVEQNRRLLDLNRNTYLQKNLAEDGAAAQTNLDLSDYKPSKTRDIRNDHTNGALNEEFHPYGQRRQINRYMESSDANDQLELPQHLINRDANNYKNRMHNNQILDNPLNKRTVDSRTAPTEEGELLFENSRDQTSNADKNDYNIESFDLNQRPRYFAKQYYNQIHSENRAMLNSNNRNNDRVYYSRDRRAINKPNLKDIEVDSENNINMVTANDNLEKTENENEEMAIRRHIKKLSENELEELFNSLSEEKRALLKKIIDDTEAQENTDSINKREITKKAGAVEDNGYVDLGQSESSKIQGGASSIDISTEYPLQNSEFSETTKQSESTILSNKCSQETNSESKIELKNSNEEKPEISIDNFVPNADGNKNQAEITNEQVTSKNEKREINIEVASGTSLEDPKLSNNENVKQSNDVVGYFSTQDEDLSQFLDDDQSRCYDGSKIYKRDIEKQSELDRKLKSLEDSFPNPESYDDPAPYSGPLIRVKRRNIGKKIKKRAAAILTDSEVGFFPYKESDDEYSDEGSEFDDDGFYDPSPNFVSKENKNVETNSQQAGGEDVNCILNTVDHGKSPNADSNRATISLGSDTDNVLSGVEGVDENLMFISGNRNRRKTEGNLSENVDDTNLIQPAYSKTPDDAVKDNTNNNLNIPIYQESDSFGGLPHNFEGDLGRYKRIRRVKQSHATEETPSNT